MINIIVAVSENNVIGNEGKIPWYLPGDLARFKHLTMDKTVVMGRKTYESLIARMKNKAAEPLKGRRKIVLTRDTNFKAPHCEIITDHQQIKRESSKGKEFWIMGGEEIYRLFLPVADFLYMTRVKAVVDGDAFFPSWNRNEWSWAYEPLNAIVESNPRDQYKWDILDLRSPRP